MRSKNFNMHRNRLTLIQSQPGFGKTELLDKLYQESKNLKKSILISISQSDNNPIALLKK